MRVGIKIMVALFSDARFSFLEQSLIVKQSYKMVTLLLFLPVVPA